MFGRFRDLIQDNSGIKNRLTQFPQLEIARFTLKVGNNMPSDANSELLRVAYCNGARYVTSMIIPVFPIIELRSGPCVRLRWLPIAS
jgi:hypothetical protein